MLLFELNDLFRLDFEYCILAIRCQKPVQIALYSDISYFIYQFYPTSDVLAANGFEKNTLCYSSS